MLISELNGILVNGDILYNKSRMGYIVLRPETQELLGQSPRFENIMKFKRMLLEDAYPELIAKNQTGRPMITAQLNNPFLVQQSFWPGFEQAVSAQVQLRAEFREF